MSPLWLIASLLSANFSRLGWKNHAAVLQRGAETNRRRGAREGASFNDRSAPYLTSSDCVADCPPASTLHRYIPGNKFAVLIGSA